VVPDHQAGPSVQLELASRRRSHDAPDVALGREEKVSEGAGLLAADSDGLTLEVGEGAAPEPVEVEVPVEENECRFDLHAVVEHLAGGERQEPVHPVATPDLEANEPAQRMVEERVSDSAETKAAATDGATNQPPCRVETPHPGCVVPGARTRET
jgi:hypothetical protein